MPVSNEINENDKSKDLKQSKPAGSDPQPPNLGGSINHDTPTYTDDNIRHLSDMEHVRTRPGM